MKLFLVAAVLGFIPSASAAPDAKSAEIEKAMTVAMGGQAAWNSAHFVRYDFVVSAGGKVVADRSHLWDKQTGRYRLDSKTKDGKAAIVLFNTANQQGEAYLDGKKLSGDEAAKALKDAYGTYINDMYWLSMPWKWTDGGVHLNYMGDAKRGDDTVDIVQLTFDHVGLTPGDVYKAFVSRKSHLMTHWEYKLQGGTAGSWDWEYAETHGVKLARNHTNEKGMSINMGKVQILDTVDPSIFSDVKKQLP